MAGTAAAVCKQSTPGVGFSVMYSLMQHDGIGSTVIFPGHQAGKRNKQHKGLNYNLK